MFKMFSRGKKRSDSTDDVQMTDNPSEFYKNLNAISKEDFEKLEDIYDKLIANNCDIEKCNFNSEDTQKAFIMEQYLSKNSQFYYLSDGEKRIAAIFDAARGEGKHFQTTDEVDAAICHRQPSIKHR